MDGPDIISRGWNPEKVEAFRSGFNDFLPHLWINSKELGRVRLGEHIYRAQTRFFDFVFDGLSRDIHDFKHLKSRQLGVCLDPATRILTADLRWIPIDNLYIGQEIVAVDEDRPKGRGNDRKMRTAKIEAIHQVISSAYKIIFEDGRELICSGRHRWLAKNPGDKHTQWKSIEPLKPRGPRLRKRNKIRWITKPWDNPNVEDGWFGGMLDGEGSISSAARTGAHICVCQLRGKVFDRLVFYVQERGYVYGIENDRSIRLTKYGKSPCPKVTIKRMDELFRLLGQTRPTRFIERRFWEGKSLPGKKSGVGWSEIKEIIPLGDRRLVDLQTSCKTYIAEGFVSHNSTGSRALTLFWTGVHEGLKGFMVFDTNQHKEEARLELIDMIKSLPDAYKFPRIVKENRDIVVLENDSMINFASAGTKEGKTTGTLGRSSGINFVHCSEMCSWAGAENVVSFKNALAHTFPNRLYIWESTGRGYNLWYDMWLEAKEDIHHQAALFTGWWAREDQFIAKSDPDFERYGSISPSDEEMEKIKLVKELYDWDITPEQLAWVRRYLDPLAKAEGDIPPEFKGDIMKVREQAWTEDDAFAMTDAVFFHPESLKTQFENNVSNKFKTYCFAHGVEFMDMKVFPAPNPRSIELRVWEEPDQDSVYVVAGDVAHGTNEHNDRSAIQVLRCYADGIDQVAEYASPLVTSQQYAWIIMALAAWYAGDTSEVYLIIELNGPGQAVWDEILSLKRLIMNGYNSREIQAQGLESIFRNVRNYIYTRPDSMGSGKAWQWKTSGGAGPSGKVRLMERLRDFFTNEMLHVRSFATLEEMKSVTRVGDTIEASGSNKDDRVVALGLGVQCWEQRARRVMAPQRRTRENEAAKRRMSIVDKASLFHENQLQSFFAGKRVKRRRDQIVLRRMAWRGR